VRFYPQFTRIVLLSAPWAVMVERIMSDIESAHQVELRRAVAPVSLAIACRMFIQPCCSVTLSEAVLRAKLAALGLNELEVDSYFAEARRWMTTISTVWPPHH